MKKSSTATIILIFTSIFIVIILLRFLLIFEDKPQIKQVSDDRCPDGKVCMSKMEYQDLLMSRAGVVAPIKIQEEVRPSLIPKSYTRERDIRVLHDDLYPAYNRADKGSFESVVDKTLERKINVPTRHYSDSYRLIGYLTNDEDEIKTWKLMAKQTDRNKSDFFMIPANRNYDMKVQITNDIVVGDKINDLYNVPKEVKFNTPLLSSGPYKFSELPKGDINDELDI